MAGRKVHFSAARVVSKRRTTGTSPVARDCYGDTSYAHSSLQNGAVQPNPLPHNTSASASPKDRRVQTHRATR